LKSIHVKGKNPTIPKLEQYMKKPGVFRESEVKRHLEKLVADKVGHFDQK
jgi:hypothetical protein